MMQNHQGADDGQVRSDARLSAALIGSSWILSIVLMTHHPTTHGGGMAAALEEMAHEAPLAGFVHGGLVVLMVLGLCGFTGFVRILGWHRPAVRAGMIGYALGVVAMSGAALTNGFVLQGIARGYVQGSVADPESLRNILELCHQVNQVLARAGVFAFAGAVVAWSLVMLPRRGTAAGIAVAGIIIGAASSAGLLSGHLRLDVHGMGAVVLALGIWSLAVAFWMLREPHRPAGIA